MPSEELGGPMIWTALLLIGSLGVPTDLVFSVRPMRHVPEVVGAVGAVLLGLLSGLTEPRESCSLARHRAGRARVGPGGHARVRRRREWVALASRRRAWHPRRPVSGRRVRRRAGRRLARPHALPCCRAAAEQALLLAGVMLSSSPPATCWCGWCSPPPAPSTRRAEGAPGPVVPAQGRAAARSDGAGLIVGLGLAGQLTAASIVVAAKGLLRWPELQAARDEERGPGSTWSPSTSWSAAS